MNPFNISSYAINNGIDIRIFRPLSNLYKLDEDIVDKNFSQIVYGSVEHAYQSAKLIDAIDRTRFILTCGTGNNDSYYGMSALKAGKKLPNVRSDWDKVKLEIMEYYVRLKFQQIRFKDFLISTGNLHIYENGHSFWGVPGLNHMGKILMKVRKEINESNT